VVIASVDDVESPYTDLTVTDNQGNTWAAIGAPITAGDYGGARRTRLFAFRCPAPAAAATNITVTSDSALNGVSAVAFVVRDADRTEAAQQFATYGEYNGGAVTVGTLTQSVGNSIGFSMMTWYDAFGRTSTVNNEWDVPVTIDASTLTAVPLTVATVDLIEGDTAVASNTLAGGGTFIAGGVFKLVGAPL
jgi:hypothetical protein